MLEVGKHNNGGEAHLRKELTALKKSRCLRDPSTCSSWKPPKSPIAPKTGWNVRKSDNEVSRFEMDLSPEPEDNREKEFLFNWRNEVQNYEKGGSENNREISSCISDKEKMVFSAETSRQGRRERVFKKKARNVKRFSTRDQEIQKSIRALNHLNLEEQVVQNDYWKNRRDSGGVDCNSRSGSPLLMRETFRSCVANGKESKRLVQSWRPRDGSTTPASTCSFSRNGHHNHSVIGSWDGDGVFSENEDLDGFDPSRQGCGIPCYWSRTPKKLGSNGGGYSPSFSDSVRRKVSNIVSKKELASSNRKARLLKSQKEGRPLLTDEGEDCRSLDDNSCSDDNTLSDGRTKLSEFDMEASCKLDMRMKKMHMGGEDQLELALTPGSRELTVYEERHRSLSQKYRPKSFDEIVGQNIVVQSLVGAISRNKVAPVYLFQGPRGTGKTSTARIFAAALNCLSPENIRPCGFCRECIAFCSGRSVDVKEVDATSSNGVEKSKSLLKNLAFAPSFSRFKVFIIDECHMLASEAWTALLKILEEPPRHIVFIFITTDSDKIPRTAVSRCQKYIFPKIKDGEIVARLQKLAIQEGLEVDYDALDMIAGKSDGSLRDAETMLDQLSLLGQRITLPMVHQLIGVVSNEKLLDLLELALSADTARTVKVTRELLDSGIEPMTLMSQLATLIMDILAGSFKHEDIRYTGTYFHRQPLTEEQLERLRRALKILSEAEKQLRVSNDQTTWLTAALLQFGGGRSILLPSSAGTSVTQSPVVVIGKREKPFVITETSSKVLPSKQKQCGSFHNQFDFVTIPTYMEANKNGNNRKAKSRCQGNKEMVSYDSNDVYTSGVCEGDTSDETNENHKMMQMEDSSPNLAKLDEVWRRALQECKSNNLRQILQAHTKLLSISIEQGLASVHIELCHPEQKSKVERQLENIANAFQVVLGCDIDIRVDVGSLPTETENPRSKKKSSDLLNVSANKQKDATTTTAAEFQSECNALKPDRRTSHKESSKGNYSSANNSSRAQSKSVQERGMVPDANSGLQSGNGPEKETAIDEQRLESAWLQAAEKCAPGLKDILRPEKNQVLPREAVDMQNGFGNSVRPGNVPLAVALQQQEGLSNDQIKQLISEGQIDTSKLRHKKNGHASLHSGSFDDEAFATGLEEDNLACGSDSNSGGIHCWKVFKINHEKTKQQRQPRRKVGVLLRVVPCAKSKR